MPDGSDQQSPVKEESSGSSRNCTIFIGFLNSFLGFETTNQVYVWKEAPSFFQAGDRNHVCTNATNFCKPIFYIGTYTCVAKFFLFNLSCKPGRDADRPTKKETTKVDMAGREVHTNSSESVTQRVIGM